MGKSIFRRSAADIRNAIETHMILWPVDQNGWT
jgi:hypothetical protein